MHSFFRFVLFVSFGAAASAAACGDDDDGADDDATVCQTTCEAEYADDADDCDACDIAYTFADGVCTCQFLSCVQDLCAAFCEEHDAGSSSAQCYLDACNCG
jgi:hypothetical protein